MKPAFSPSLVKRGTKVDAGASDMPSVPTAAIADEVFGGVVPGQWLTCYMLRRFGWPNIGSDPHKDLCAWMLTTPLDGLYLGVRPYLGEGANLHFSLYYTNAVRGKLLADPGRDRYVARKDAAIVRWWKNVGATLYIWGRGTEVGDEDELVHLYAKDPESPGHVWGLWRRTPKHGKHGRKLPEACSMVNWWLGEFIRKAHPEVHLPKMSAREKVRRATPFQRKAYAAVRTALSAMLCPTNIRDLSLSPLGEVGRTPAATKRSAKLEHVAPFADAGNTPQHLFTTLARKRRKPAKA